MGAGLASPAAVSEAPFAPFPTAAVCLLAAFACGLLGDFAGTFFAVAFSAGSFLAVVFFAAKGLELRLEAPVRDAPEWTPATLEVARPRADFADLVPFSADRPVAGDFALAGGLIFAAVGPLPLVVFLTALDCLAVFAERFAPLEDAAAPEIPFNADCFFLVCFLGLKGLVQSSRGWKLSKW